MRREVERTTAIVQNLLDFTRPKDPVRKAMNLVKVMEESLALISNKLSLANIEVMKFLNPLPEIQADPAHMKQVCLNLLINACEAMEGGGTLTIRSDYRPDTHIVTISVRDTGVGIEEKDRVRIFDPFFSTKKKGTGLGLSVINGIVTRHGGKVEIDSTPGKGTDFRVILPVG
jgi:two-component system NtrC family sensor kinase